ncbi:hypothetical protein AYK24_06610 [Thermoplasmatales archaeon SG8-52-4]|nr:MAG: hypothetical protein AYK24_06610 [Thermoplasmatales archaeon SG8-52-4]
MSRDYSQPVYCNMDSCKHNKFNRHEGWSEGKLICECPDPLHLNPDGNCVNFSKDKEATTIMQKNAEDIEKIKKSILELTKKMEDMDRDILALYKRL